MTVDCARLADRWLTTASAARRLGKSEQAFKDWARRRGLRPASIVRQGRARVALWDIEAVLDADADADTRR